ncbi:MAG: type II toxin-antitoxin system RelB/DinJ family antitoxin [Patescibacteria group bacterium]
MDTTINIRTNKEIRNKARKVFSSLGISTSAGVNMFLHQVVQERGLPFTPTVDAKKIREKWDRGVSKTIDTYKKGKQKGFANAKDLHGWIDGK